MDSNFSLELKTLTWPNFLRKSIDDLNDVSDNISN